ELQDILVSIVTEDCLIGIGGMMLYRRPVAACKTISQLGLPISIITFSAGYEIELLAAAGVLQTLRTTYAGMEVFGPAPMLRRAVESGSITLIDETELTIAAGLPAATLELPWFPVSHGLI